MAKPIILEKLAKHTTAAKERLAAKSDQEAETPAQMFLPGMDEFIRAMPNHLARSSLFAPVAPGRKTMHDGVVLVSRGDATIKFWGKQLDETQADVWMQAMYEAAKVPLGEPIIITRSRFLSSIGRSAGKAQYKWLDTTMKALTFGMLVIEVQAKDGTTKLAIGKTRAIHLIEGFDYDDDVEAYTLRVDPRWRGMYDNKEYALIDWEKRLKFGLHQDMAKALQRLAATSDEDVQRFELSWLKSKLEYSGRMRDFKGAVEKAMRELERLEIIAGGRIEKSTRGKEQVAWTKLRLKIKPTK